MTIRDAAIQDPTIPGERLITQFSREQRGWMAAALVAFIGVVVIGPALTATTASGRRMAKTARRKIRRLGGGGPQSVMRPGR